MTPRSPASRRRACAARLAAAGPRDTCWPAAATVQNEPPFLYPTGHGQPLAAAWQAETIGRSLRARHGRSGSRETTGDGRAGFFYPTAGTEPPATGPGLPDRLDRLPVKTGQTQI